MSNKSPWVKATERLPEKSGDYKVKRRYSDFEQPAYFDGKTFTNYDGYEVEEWYDKSLLESPARYSEDDAIGFGEYYYQRICRDKSHEKLTKKEIFAEYLQSLPVNAETVAGVQKLSSFTEREQHEVVDIDSLLYEARILGNKLERLQRKHYGWSEIAMDLLQEYRRISPAVATRFL